MLQRIKLPEEIPEQPLSSVKQQLLAEADRRIDSFQFDRKGGLIPGFVASDFRLVDACLHWLTEHNLLTGRAFCEWGSGFGVATMMAALHQLDACGVEVEAELVERAQLLADDLGIAAQFVQGSAIPEAAEKWLEFLEDLAHVDTDFPSAYDELGMEISDFDLIYVFPWPGEQRFWEALFDRYAAQGAILMSYHGREAMHLHRKVKRSRR